MKKVQRSISLRSAGLFRGNSRSAGHNDEHSHILEHTSFELNERDNETNGEESSKGSLTVGEKQGFKSNGVRRSKTVAYNRSVSFEKTPRSKYSKRMEDKPTSPQPCLICYSDFTQPKQLPCLHTFCHHCLLKFVNPKLMVQCPTCKKVSYTFIGSELKPYFIGNSAECSGGWSSSRQLSSWGSQATSGGCGNRSSKQQTSKDGEVSALNI